MLQREKHTSAQASCRHGCSQPDTKLACHRLRKIWVDERMSLDRADGPDNSQACQIMGNSVQAWQKSYDLNFSMRESQAGVDSTASWRRAMLEKGSQVVCEFESVD